MIPIPLTQGFTAWVSDRDAPRVREHKWCAAKCGKHIYASTRVGRSHVYLHRFVASLCGIDVSTMIDHRNGDGLNNTRRNIRKATRSQNGWNQHSQTKAVSGVRGVYERRYSWQVTIRVNGVLKQVGSFKTLAEATLARRCAERRYFGAFAPSHKR